jgi:hypothetical protein
MKRFPKFCLAAALSGAMLLPSTGSFAGNPDRAGQAGATELLINPWARSSGWGGANSSACRGLESMYLNIAGTAFTKKTEILFCRTNWLVGTGININSFGFTQKVGATGVLGLGIMSMDFGDIMITTVEKPEGGIGTYSPQFINLGLSYAKAFSDNIYGGLTIRGITESLSDVQAKGMALDAGIQYVTGKWDNIHFGISLRNVGPRMRFRGDGLSFRGTVPTTGISMTVEQRSADFELPSMVNIGGAYDFYFPNDTSAKKTHRVTVAANFVSNSFQKDQFVLGVEYGFRSFLMVRAGYAYEKGITNTADDPDKESRNTVFTGPTAGFTIEIPMNKAKGSTFGLDYSYRATNPFKGVHSFGARINL